MTTFEHCDGSKFSREGSLTFEEAKAIAWNKAISEKGSMWMPSSFEVDSIHTEAAELYATAKAAQAWEEGLSDGLKADIVGFIPTNPYKQEKP